MRRSVGEVSNLAVFEVTFQTKLKATAGWHALVTVGRGSPVGSNKLFFNLHHNVEVREVSKRVRKLAADSKLPVVPWPVSQRPRYRQ